MANRLFTLVKGDNNVFHILPKIFIIVFFLAQKLICLVTITLVYSRLKHFLSGYFKIIFLYYCSKLGSEYLQTFFSFSIQTLKKCYRCMCFNKKLS